MCAARILTELPVEVVRWHWRTKFKSFCPIVRLPLHLSKERVFETSWQFQKLTWSVFPCRAKDRIIKRQKREREKDLSEENDLWKANILKLSSSPPKNGCWGDELYTFFCVGARKFFFQEHLSAGFREGKSWKNRVSTWDSMIQDLWWFPTKNHDGLRGKNGLGRSQPSYMNCMKFDIHLTNTMSSRNPHAIQMQWYTHININLI